MTIYTVGEKGYGMHQVHILNESVEDLPQNDLFKKRLDPKGDLEPISKQKRINAHDP